MTDRLLTVTASIQIARPIDVVRRHFADVEHHAETDVHHGVTFTLLEDSGEVCRFRKTEHVLGFPFVDEVILKREHDGTVAEQFVSGSNAGTTLTSRFHADGPAATTVAATIDLRLRGVKTLLGPLLRPFVMRRLVTALDEDRRDLEERGYEGAFSDVPAVKPSGRD